MTTASDQGKVLTAWIHVSDVHFGHGAADHQWDQRLITDDLLRDIAEVVGGGQVPRPRQIFVTGDIAFSGGGRTPATGESEYGLAAAWLDQLAAKVGLARGNVFLVPGNHDVDRSVDKKRGIRRLIGYARDGREDLDTLLGHPEDLADLRRRMAGYFEFAQPFGPASREVFCEGLWWRHGIELDDGINLRICGFNTALLSADNHDKGKLRLGKGQLAQLVTARGEREVVLVLSHHPVTGGWLADEKAARGRLDRERVVHLYGHLHEAESEQARHGWGAGSLRIAAGAAHAEAAGGEEVPTGHGYNFGALVLLPDGEVVVRIWPRRWSAKGTRFVPDADHIDETKGYAEHSVLRVSALAQPAQPAQPEQLPAAPSSPQALGPGVELAGRYRLVEKLGQGGSGEVWRAEDLRTSGEYVAVKVLNPDGRPSPAHLRRPFFEGPQQIKRICDPRLVRIHEVIADGVYDLVVMDFVEGRDLAAAFGERGSRPAEAEVIRILCEVAEGMEEAHRCGVIHRDLKPSNVILGADGSVRVIDFETVRDLRDVDRTRTVVPRMTDAYASPERRDAPEEVDHRTDIFSLALTGYFLLTGRHPQVSEVYRKRALARLRCSEALRAVLERGSKTEAEGRYATMAEFAAALQGTLRTEEENVPALSAQQDDMVLDEWATVFKTAQDSRSWKKSEAFEEAVRGEAVSLQPQEEESEVEVWKAYNWKHRWGAAVGAVAVMGMMGMLLCPAEKPGTSCRPGMALIEGGTFKGHVIEDFCMDLTEVTVAAFRAQVSRSSLEKARSRNAQNSSPQGDEWCNARYRDRDGHPINCVDWEQADSYCRSKGKRLPTEWEWEWAARGRDKGWRYPWGDSEPSAKRVNACGSECKEEGKRVLGIDFRTMYSDNDGFTSTAPVGSKPLGDSRDGLMDMSGNVWEWTASKKGEERVLRGGSWHRGDPEEVSAANRGFGRPSRRYSDYGFRCASSVR